MEFKDYYQILGVKRTSDQKAISQAFRKLARQHHPDVNRDDKQAEAKFKEINEAYQVLHDPEKRAKYDEILDLRARGGGWEEMLRRGAGPGPGGDGTYTVYGSPENLEEFSDFFQQLFGGLAGGPFGAGAAGEPPKGRRRGGFRIDELFGRGPGAATAERRPMQQDVEGTIEISLEEAYRGATRTVTIPAGGGRAAHTIEVTIPKGVRSGQRIRAAGQGLGGDLYLTVEIAAHPTFTRAADDLLCEIAVPVWTAALGGAVEVSTLGGPVTMTIPEGTRDGRTLRLRGRGMPHLRGEGAGDELVTIRLALPHPLTAKDRELFEEMRRQHEGTAAKS